MPIRTVRKLTTETLSAALPAFLSDLTWSGAWRWTLTALCGAEIFSLLAAFAWRGANGRLPDLTTMLVAIPAGVMTMLVVIAVLWRLIARIPLEAGLSFLARILPLAWLAPAADLLRSAGQGFVMAAVQLDAPDYLLASLTGGLLPASGEGGMPFAIRAGIFLTSLLAAFVVWFACNHIRRTVREAPRNLMRALLAGLITSIVLVKLSFLSSLLGIWSFLLRTGRGIEGVIETQREAVIAVTNGYWWTNLYDRFPSGVEAQADLAIRLTTSGLFVMSLGIVLAALFIWLVPARGRTLTHFFRTRSAFDLVLYVAGAAILTRVASATPAIHGTWWYAAVLIILLAVALRVHAVLERCLHHARIDGDALAPGDPSEGPVACGDITPPVAADISRMAFAYALVAAWMLGWPVFAATVAFLAASHLSRDPFWHFWPPIATFFRSAGAAALALAGFFFAGQHARLTGMAAFVMLLAAAHRAGTEMFWKSRRRP